MFSRVVSYDNKYIKLEYVLLTFLDFKELQRAQIALYCSNFVHTKETSFGTRKPLVLCPTTCMFLKSFLTQLSGKTVFGTIR